MYHGGPLFCRLRHLFFRRRRRRRLISAEYLMV